jgi:ketopantoate reductase
MSKSGSRTSRKIKEKGIKLKKRNKGNNLRVSKHSAKRPRQKTKKELETDWILSHSKSKETKRLVKQVTPYQQP